MVSQRNSFQTKAENCESDLMKELCKIAGVQKLHTTTIILKAMVNVKGLTQHYVICWVHCLKKKNQIGNHT